MTRIPATLALATLAVVALAAFALALGVGSVALDPMTVLRALAGGGDATARTIVQELRLPRALAAFATGGSLAMAGALLQVLLRNPLADPYVLGVSGGAAVGALAAMLLGAAAWLIPVGAFAGAFVSTVLVFALARGSGAWSPTRLLLTGVIVAAGWGAVVALLLSLAPEAQLRGMLFWLIGDLSAPPAAWTPLIVLGLAMAIALPFARDLNALSRGDAVAAALGVAIARLPWLIFALAALLTAVAVTTAGAIGFVGLIVPHAVRLVIGNDQRGLLPASALAGGAMLLIADTLARQLAAPAQLPVGVVTALIGVPLFLILLRRER
jgi:iron complex transport system permease protein